MYQGDESFTFRSDRQGRRKRAGGRLGYDMPETGPSVHGRGPGEGLGDPVPVPRSAAEERVARLEAAVVRLERLVGQVEEVLGTVAQRHQSPPRMDRPHGEEQAVQMLTAYGDEGVTAPGISSENVRVSLFADGGVSAVLGQVRILE